MDPNDAVLEANRAYYRAFEGQDFDAMSDLWERSERVLCTHPGWATLRGWAQVGASYAALFQHDQQLQFLLTREWATVVGEVAWVSCDENLLGDASGVTVAALNVFVAAPSRWRMVAHHGSVVHSTVGIV